MSRARPGPEVSTGDLYTVLTVRHRRNCQIRVQISCSTLPRWGSEFANQGSPVDGSAPTKRRPGNRGPRLRRRDRDGRMHGSVRRGSGICRPWRRRLRRAGEDVRACSTLPPMVIS